jgi:hypothetical protein
MPGLTGAIFPKGVGDKYPMVEDINIKGAHHTVADIAARDAIYPERRKEGMTCYVVSLTTTYQLRGGITNSDWVPTTIGVYHEDTRPPKPTDDYNAGFRKNITWIANSGTSGIYGIWICRDPTPGAAVWELIKTVEESTRLVMALPSGFGGISGVPAFFESIQQGITAGYDIFILAGTHQGPIIANSNLFLYGLPRKTALLEQPPGASLPLIQVNGTGLAGGNQFELRDIELSDSGNGTAPLIVASDLENFQYSNRLSSGISGSAAVSHFYAGGYINTFVFTDVDKMSFSNLSFYGYPNAYIEANDADKILVQDCDFESNDPNAICVFADGTSPGVEIEVNRCKCFRDRAGGSWDIKKVVETRVDNSVVSVNGCFLPGLGTPYAFPFGDTYGAVVDCKVDNCDISVIATDVPFFGNPIRDPDYVVRVGPDDSVSLTGYVGNTSVAILNGLAPVNNNSYVVTNSGLLIRGAVNVNAGDVVQDNGVIWTKIITNIGGRVPSGTRLLVNSATPLISPLVEGTDDGKIAEFDGVTNIPSFSVPNSGDGVYVLSDLDAVKHLKQFVFSGSVPSGTWNQTSAVTGNSVRVQSSNLEASKFSIPAGNTLVGSYIDSANNKMVTSYTPAVPGNWLVPPITTQQALDQIAAKIGPI